MNDFIALIMIIVVYFLPYFFIFTLIKLSAGSLGKIQAGLDKAGQFAKDSGRVKSFKEQATKSRAEAVRAKNLNRANKNIDSTSRIGRGFQRTQKYFGQSGLGTLGATGSYGKQARRLERQEALKKANEEIFEDMRDRGITDYDDQLSYLQAMAMGEKIAYKTNGAGQYELDEHGNRITVGKIDNAYDDIGMQAAAQFVAKQQKAGRNRVMFGAMITQGKDAVVSDVMAEAAGDIKKVSADVVGKPFEALKTEELVTQDASSLKVLYESQLHNAVNAGDFNKVDTMLKQIRAAKSSEVYMSATDEKSRSMFDNIEAQLQNLSMSGPANFEADYQMLYQMTNGTAAPTNAPTTLHDAPGDTQQQKAAKMAQRRQYDIKLVGDPDYR